MLSAFTTVSGGGFEDSPQGKMKALEVIEPLSKDEAAELQRLEFVILKLQKHVDNWVEAIRAIRDGRLYRVEFGTFADYCEKKLKKSIRAVQLAFQLDDVRKDVAQTLRIDGDQQTRAIAEKASENVIAKIANVPKAKRAAVLKEAAKETKGKVTGKSIERAAAKVTHTALPKREQRGGFKPEENLPPLESKRNDFNRYAIGETAKPEFVRGARPPLIEGAGAAKEFRAAVESGKYEPCAVKVTNTESAVKRLEFIYEREKSWFNVVPLRTPRAILDKLIDGMRE